MPEAKVREIRQRFSRGDIRIRGQYTPRSRTWIQSPNTPSQVRKAKLGDGTLYPMDVERVVWDLPLDQDVRWLSSGSGTTTLKAGNVLVEYDAVGGAQGAAGGHRPLERDLF